MAEWSWQQVMWIARWTWDKATVTVFAEYTWHQLTQMANGTWDTIAWIMNFCTTLIGLLTGAVSELYAKYFKTK